MWGARQRGRIRTKSGQVSGVETEAQEAAGMGGGAKFRKQQARREGREKKRKKKLRKML